MTSTAKTEAPVQRVTDTALIFEGGGMRASLTSAVVVALLKAGIHFDYVVGISAGASNLANYLSCDPVRAQRSFVHFAADPKFGDMRTFLRGDGLFNARYIYQETGLPDQALPFDWETFRANPAEFRIGAFAAETGREVFFSREDVPEMADLMIRVRASSTMPVLMPPVRIGDETFVDGALGADGGIALSQAEKDGCEKFFVVLSQERSYIKQPQRFPGFYRQYFRRHPAIADALTTRWKRYNDTRERLFELERAGRAHLFVPEVMPVGNGERSLSRLAASHRLGLSQSRRELPAWREFLGLA
ncbi:patatin-like phospholipase family protein [Brevibacterium daeguense]|uniref:Patatin-like phospholipase family protein n=1 Tax=Brevibacterium daeguense TaxID=909936 RepID=A0ABP8EJH8_9MICO|nr:patatin family protein [Brevibacterium daeguense]